MEKNEILKTENNMINEIINMLKNMNYNEIKIAKSFINGIKK